MASTALLRREAAAVEWPAGRRLLASEILFRKSSAEDKVKMVSTGFRLGETAEMVCPAPRERCRQWPFGDENCRQMDHWRNPHLRDGPTRPCRPRTSC